MKFRNQHKNSSDPFTIQERSVKNGILKKSYRLEWVEESHSSSKNANDTVGKSFDFNKVRIISFILVFFIFILFFRIAWLQVVKGEYYYNLAEGNRIRIDRVEAKRGVIYDARYRPLVRNVANFLLYFTPIDLPNSQDEKDKIIKKVCSILGNIAPEEINGVLSKIKRGSLESYQPIFIADNIEYEKAILLDLESADMPGVVLTNKTRREYNLASMSLSHILGYTGKINNKELAKSGDEYLLIDYIGKMGIEYFWENELKGVNGKKQIEVDALGKEKKIINEEPAQDGHNLVLSLNIEVQKKLEEAVAAELDIIKLKKASAIVMDPNNGEIIAMVSLPAYNNNVFARGISTEEYHALADDPDNPLFNRSVSGEYPSGSVIKPVMAAAALEEGIINENTTVNSTGGIRIKEWYFPDWKAGGHGTTNVKKAIAESVNTFFYYIGGGYEQFTGLGVDRINKYGKLFGLYSQSGIDLPGEADGFLPTKEWKESAKGESWYVGDTYHLAIGQGDLLVTPLQVANYTSVFANGGRLYRPHLIKQLLTDNDQIVGDIQPEVIRENFIKDDNIRIVREGMRKTITSGSAQSLQAIPVEVAGKTGTAQLSGDKHPEAWFTGFAPYNNPEIVITILLEEGGEGSSVAVPIAKDVLAWYFGEYLTKKAK